MVKLTVKIWLKNLSRLLIVKKSIQQQVKHQPFSFPFWRSASEQWLSDSDKYNTLNRVCYGRGEAHALTWLIYNMSDIMIVTN